MLRVYWIEAPLSDKRAKHKYSAWNFIESNRNFWRRIAFFFRHRRIETKQNRNEFLRFSSYLELADGTEWPKWWMTRVWRSIEQARLFISSTLSISSKYKMIGFHSFCAYFFFSNALQYRQRFNFHFYILFIKWLGENTFSTFIARQQMQIFPNQLKSYQLRFSEWLN